MDTDRNDRIALDVHAHLAPIVPDRLAAFDGAAWDADDMRLTLDDRTLGLKPLFKPDVLIGWMDDNGVEQAWVSVPPPLYRQTLAPAQASRWVDYVNAGLAAVCGAYQGRLAPLYHLPLEHPSLAQDVAESRISHGARRFSAPAGGTRELALSDPRYEGLWKVLDANACFLFLHPASCADGRLAAFYLENLLGNPHETAVAVAHLVFGGVCERYPRMRFCLAHGGGATAMVAGRWQRGFDTKRPGVDTTRSAPRAILRRVMADCVVHDGEALRLAASVFGTENIVFGSDWPFPMGLPSPQRQLENVASDLRRQILSANGSRLKALYT